MYYYFHSSSRKIISDFAIHTPLISKKVALSDNLFSFFWCWFFCCLPTVRLSMCGLTVEFFCCSPTCQPTNWLKCQIFKVSAHPDKLIYLCTIIIWIGSFYVKRSKYFSKNFCSVHLTFQVYQLKRLLTSYPVLCIYLIL